MNIGQKKGKPKVVLDSNVIISGLNFKGNPREILNLVLLKQVELYVSPFILKEVAEVLERKFDWDEGRIKGATEGLKAVIIKPERRISIIKQDEDDNRILECAIEGKAQYIISGDEHHLLPLNAYQGIKILSPAEFLKLLTIIE